MKISVRMKGSNEKLAILISRLASLVLCPDADWSQGEVTLGFMPNHLPFCKRSLRSIVSWSARLVSHPKHVPAVPGLQPTLVQLLFHTESSL